MNCFSTKLQTLLSTTYQDVTTDLIYRIFMDPNALRTKETPPKKVVNDLAPNQLKEIEQLWKTLHRYLRHDGQDLDNKDIGLAFVRTLREIDLLRRASGNFRAINKTSSTRPVSRNSQTINTKTNLSVNTHTNKTFARSRTRANRSQQNRSLSIDESIIEDVQDVQGNLQATWYPSKKTCVFQPKDNQAIKSFLTQLLQHGGILVQITPPPAIGMQVRMQVRLPTWGTSLLQAHIATIQNQRVTIAVNISHEKRQFFSRVLRQIRHSNLRHSNPIQKAFSSSKRSGQNQKYKSEISPLTSSNATVESIFTSENLAIDDTNILSPLQDTDALISSILASNVAIIEEITGTFSTLAHLVNTIGAMHEHWEVTLKGTHQWTVTGRRKRVVDIKSSFNPPELDLLSLLIAKGWISPQRAQKVRPLAKRNQESFARILLDNHWLNEELVTKAERARLILALRQLKKNTFKNFHFVSYNRSIRNPVTSISIESIPFRDIFQKYLAQQMLLIQRKLNTRWNQHPKIAANQETSLQLDPSQRKIVRSMNGKHSLATLERNLSVDSKIFRAVILTLDELKLITWQKVDAYQARLLILQKPLMERLKLLKTSNPFDGLGMHWSAHEAELRAQTNKLRTKLQLDFVIKNGNQAQKALVVEIDQLINQAMKKLETQRLRKRVRQQMITQNEQIAAIKHLIEKGKMLLFRGDVSDARDVFKRCLELKPNDPTASRHLKLIRGR